MGRQCVSDGERIRLVYLYGMDKDKSYDNVILAVVGNADTDIRNSMGDFICVMAMEVPQNVARRYLMLAFDQGQALCHQNVKENCTRLTTHVPSSSYQIVNQVVHYICHAHPSGILIQTGQIPVSP